MSLVSYALSVFGLIMLSTIAELMLPSGSLKKTAKIVFSLIITLTLLTPAIKLLKGGDYDIPNIEIAQIEVDKSFEEYALYLQKINAENDIKTLISSKNYTFKFSVECVIDEKIKKLKTVTIKCDFSGINEKDKHIYINEIESFIASTYNLSKEDVFVIGG